jgi:cytochrome c
MRLIFFPLLLPILLPVYLGAAACTDQPPDSDFFIEKLVGGAPSGDGMDLDIAKDGRVFWTERTTKKLQVFDQKTKTTSIIHTFSSAVVTSENTNYLGNGNEGGLQGIALDGNFATNHFVYIYYTPKVPTFSLGEFKPKERLSRFTLTDADTKLDLASEKILLEFTIYAQCCHHGGDLEWGPDGNLWLTTGDNTSLSYNSDGVPINNTDAKFDARSGTANTNSYRGKILRIHPETTAQPDGKWYTIPKGNLFPPGTALTLPEIYSMGHRNPYSISIESRKYGTPEHPWVLDGEAGPAKGTDEVNLIKAPGFFGWPFLNRNNFSMGTSNYDANNIVNSSPFNTGMQKLPPAQPAIAWYGEGGNSGHGISGCVPGAGPFMTFDSTLNSTVKFPPWFDDKVILFQGWGGSYWVGKLSAQGVLSEVKKIFNNGLGGAVLRLKRGPDGALYSISNGGGFFVPGGGDKIFKISYKGTCNPPVVVGVRDGSAGHAVPAHAPTLTYLNRASTLSIPAGVTRVELYNTAGRIVWSQGRGRGSPREILPSPAHLREGVYSMRFITD